LGLPERSSALGTFPTLASAISEDELIANRNLPFDMSPETRRRPLEDLPGTAVPEKNSSKNKGKHS